MLVLLQALTRPLMVESHQLVDLEGYPRPNPCPVAGVDSLHNTTPNEPEWNHVSHPT